jgi:hypothetical protein
MVVYDTMLDVTIVGLQCANCSMPFGISQHFMKERRDDHKSFSCPNGHSNFYPGKSDLEVVQAERDAARELAQRERRRRELATQEAEHQKRRVAAAKGRITRMKNRIANGVCPCCNRSFSALREHMRNEHPDFKLPDLADVES